MSELCFTADIPKEPGTYLHRWDFNGKMKEHVLFVGFIDWTKPRGQGLEKSHWSKRLRCCEPDQNLHADRLTPSEWGGWWKRLGVKTSEPLEDEECEHFIGTHEKY